MKRRRIARRTPGERYNPASIAPDTKGYTISHAAKIDPYTNVCVFCEMPRHHANHPGEA